MDSLSLNSLPWFPLLILLLLSSLYLLYSMKMSKKTSNNLPPGPPRLPIIGNLHQLGNLPHRSLRSLSQKYGPVMLLRLGQIPTLVVSSPETAKQVLKTHDLECCSRPFSRGPKRLSYNLLDLAFGPYSDYWREMRKLCMIELFTVKRVQSFRPIREAEIARLISSLSLISGNPVMLSENIFSLTNNIVCRIAFGKSYEGRQFESNKFEKTIDEAMVMLSSFWGSDFFPYVGWILDVVSGLHWRLEKLFHKFDMFFERVIEEHIDPTRTKSSEHEDITDILLGLSKDETASFRLTKDHIKAILMDIFIGAIDTSSLTLVWAMTELAKNPSVMKKVQSEIRSSVGRKSQVWENDLGKLKYLKMVVKETFRLHPPATLLIPRESIQHCQIGGYDVYPKTRILVNAWAIGRDPGTWANPDVFYPDRFEGSEIDFKGQNFELLPFGAGRRICPGLTMGATAVEFTLANLLHCFDWKIPSGMKREQISLEEEAGLTVHKKLPLYLVPEKYNWEDYKIEG
ncbi:4-hydroxyphenylacetaldehyde oxime monooxygenase [Actinidia chinensis var. chinensis]|uniref:4-hydroxyphenylacetaldehyde oxime monooxygenase n=1 Tax=Actinidia chinensis var. chinensis TaxID=1590841 RepID=A0A2R6P6G6_ACTCC|nr:4-hydroxyphenylacetaldehyde oxime monooxygenase [Actinidia chinensis var. chinensis]